jgi:hypothetical protein
MQAYRQRKPWRRAARAIAARSTLPAGWTLATVEALTSALDGRSRTGARRRLAVAFVGPWSSASVTTAVLATPQEIAEKRLTVGPPTAALGETHVE